MFSHLRAAIPELYLLWITMAQIAGQEDREKTTALKDLLSRIDLDELMKKDEPPFTFPKTLEEFEYAFNEYGQLRHVKTGEPFVFNAREDLHRWNQKRYEALGEIITQYVYELLEKKCNMTKAILPVDATEDEATSFIYLSPDALSNPSKLLVLVQGSGVVRAGQWARRLIINQDLDSGTQLPFITRAIEEGYAVMVLNPNENYLELEKPAVFSPLPSPTEPSDEPAEKKERKEDKEGKKKREFYEKYRNPQKETETERIPVRENGSSEEHVLYVWDHFVSRAAAKNVFIVAHSYGGLSFVELHCSNWVSSPEPLDTPLDPMLPDCPRVSAGDGEEIDQRIALDNRQRATGRPGVRKHSGTLGPENATTCVSRGGKGVLVLLFGRLVKVSGTLHFNDMANNGSACCVSALTFFSWSDPDFLSITALHQSSSYNSVL
ncbi:cotranscriptional regulator FAM172A homolog isoform X2 [Pseudoliparis swirei]|uniref:cotranscriptional regulator FAM172A homolog isoform X2 n=1 Tax=Pseudoliparis swirei TaxID=2059687 RepID=UPI0024BE5372|nr:cotranscriptional regulator FAM172A homolog isoform X2 [Pseudoliparis swirei]